MNQNPFVLPGFGQTGPAAQNPILASMEMMRQAWEGLASGGIDAAAMGKMMSVEELDRRISDLRAVENWLRMNLSMLSSTIRGMEVQRATIATLKSFMETGVAQMESGIAQMTQHDAPPKTASDAARKPRDPDAPSPLEEALGMKHGAPQPAPEPASPGATADAAPASGADASKAASEAAGAGVDPSELMGAAASAAQGWWNLLQQQFQTLAAATAASAESAAALRPAAGGADAAQGGTAKTAAPRGARKTAPPAAEAPPAAKPARKAAAKRAGKTAAARKTAPGKSG